MSLKRAVAAGVKAALNTVREFMVEVEWTFVTSDAGQYDPMTDSFTTSSDTISNLSVLIWDDKDDDTQMMFSSRGNFVESPTQMDTLKVLIEAETTGGRKPTTSDKFVWDGEEFGIDNVERIPGDSVFIARASRT